MDEEPTVTNSKENDHPWDQALIDAVPVPPSSRDDSSNIDPDDPFSLL